MLKKINAQRVGENARKAVEEYRKSDSFWQNNVEFNQSYGLTSEKMPVIEKFFEELFPEDKFYNKLKKVEELEILVANLLKQNFKPISISMNVNDYSESKYNKVTKFTIKLVKTLHEKGYIKMKKGFHDTKNPKDSRLTRIFAELKLLTHLEKLPEYIIFKPVELVILRDENKKPIDYEDTAKTYRIRKILSQVNKVNNQAKIYHHNDKLSCALVAIFSESFNLNGRLHTRGHNRYQDLSEIKRSEITINGETTIERDFKALHPNLLYASEGIQYEGDPYCAAHSNPIARPFLKSILLSLLNSKNFIKAESASNYWLFENPIERSELKEIGIDKARPLIERFFEVHKPISHHFCSGKVTGLKIMNKDASIALDVVNHFASMGVPILAIHDSFIVQKKYDSELVQIMQEMYSKHTGGFKCLVD